MGETANQQARHHALLQNLKAERTTLRRSVEALALERTSWQDQIEAAGREQARLEILLQDFETQRTELQHMIESATTAYDQLQRELQGIHESVAWKLILRYRRVVDRFLPVGTLRRRIYRRFVRDVTSAYRAAKATRGGLLTSPLYLVSHLSASSGLLWRDLLHRHKRSPAGQMMQIDSVMPPARLVPRLVRSEEKNLTIICASYKRHREIHVLINSLLCQTLNNWKLLIIHDGYDETMEAVLRPYCQHSHIEVMFTEKRHNDYGHSLREIGLARAQTEFVMFTNDDNYYAPKFLEYMFESLECHNLDLVLCNMIHSHKNPGKYRQDDYHLFDSYPRMCLIDIGNFIVRKSIAQEVGFTNKSFAADGHFIEMIMNSYKVVSLIPGWRWNLSLLMRQWWAPNREIIRVGKVDRVLFVHN